MFEAYGSSLNKAKMPREKSRISWNLFSFSPTRNHNKKWNSRGLACWNNQTWSYQPFHQSSGEYIPWQLVQIQKPHGVCCIPRRQNIKMLFPAADYDTVTFLAKKKNTLVSNWDLTKHNELSVLSAFLSWESPTTMETEPN